MKKFSRHILSLLFAIVLANSAYALEFPNFKKVKKLVLNGSAQAISTGDGKALRLVSSSAWQAGSSFLKLPVKIVRFSTFFKFRITNPSRSIDDCNSSSGADGFVFVIQPMGNTQLGGKGGNMGYGGIAPSLGVEFDTWCNAIESDISSNELAVDLNGSVIHDGNLAQVDIGGGDFDDGNLWYAWADYDGAVLEVRLSRDGVRPIAPALSQPLNLPQILGNRKAYVGFTAGTAGGWEDVDILSWIYKPSYQPIRKVPKTMLSPFV